MPKIEVHSAQWMEPVWMYTAPYPTLGGVALIFVPAAIPTRIVRKYEEEIKKKQKALLNSENMKETEWMCQK